MVKADVRVNDISREFNLGLSLIDGLARNENTGEEMEVSMFIIGLFFIDISIIW